MATNPFTQVPTIAKDYSLYDAPAVPGMPYGMGTPVYMPFLNRAGQVKAKWTIATPASVDANDTYTVVVNGTTISVNTAGDTNQAQLTTLLLNALRGNINVTMGNQITVSGNTITIEALAVGTPLTVTCPTNASTTNDLTLSEVESSVDGKVVPFGRFVGRKFDFGARVAALVNSGSTTHATGEDGYLLHGVTLSTHAGERVGRGLIAEDGYQPYDTMNVMTDRGSAEGIWVECTPENDIKEADSYGGASLFVATTAGFEGMLTKDDTTYTGLSLGSKVTVMRDSIKVLNEKVIAMITFGNLSV